MTRRRETAVPKERMPASMRALLDRGGVILTANARAARSLERRHAEAQLAEGVTVWPTARIVDLSSWLAEQWKVLLLTGTEDRLLLNEVQEQAQWQRIMTPLLRKRSLIEPVRMARLAQEAYGLLATYGALQRLHDPLWMVESFAEPELFRGWARRFQEECRRRRWLPRCELSGVITDAVRWGALTVPTEVGLLGFDSPTPAEQELMAALTASGTKCQALTWKIDPIASPGAFQAQSETEEISACADWVLSHLKGTPGIRIGILMPDLTSRRAQIERQFYRRLRPEAFPITAGGTPRVPFEFSLGQPLAQVPLVHAALLLLRWLRKPLTQQEISWLLLSGNLAPTRSDVARSAMAQWDAKLRNAKCAPPEMSLDTLLRQTPTGAVSVDVLRRNLTTMIEAHRRASGTTTAGGWVERVGVLLQTGGWGEPRDASSLLYQAREAWEHLLDSVASLDLAGRSMRYDEFLDVLERTAQDTIFATESKDAPVQVMGVYAAAGQAFDAVWFLGASDTAWPAAGHTHPLLPVAVQRDCGMPHTSPSDDYALAHRVTERVIENAGEIVFSYAMQTEEAMQRGSSLISSFTPIRVETITTPLAALDQDHVDLEQIPDDTWVPLVDSGITRGGQTALKRQADCPFQAFFFHRLRVQELPIAGRGLSAMDRGRLLHEVLEGVWSRDIAGHRHLKGHAELLAALACGSLRDLVTAHTQTSIRGLGADTSERWQRSYLAAERERVIGLVMEWLEHESRRTPFLVAAVEKKISIQVGALALDVRADRIDQAADGQLLIDYKTGEVSPSSWEGARPEQPQLPLYAAFGNVDELCGALFAQVRRPKLAFKGRVADAQKNLATEVEANGKQIAPYTPHVVEEWRETLVQLAESFMAGEAIVDPRVYPKTCRYCPLPGVCRVAELHALGVVDAADDEEAS